MIKPLMLVMALPLMLLSGCPAEFSVPLTNAADANLVDHLEGTWKLTNPQDDENVEYHVARFNENEYLVQAYALGNASLRIDNYRFFIGTWEGEKYLNLQALDDDRKWMIYKMIVSDDMVSLTPVSGDFEDIPEEFASSGDLQKFVKKQMGKAGFWGESIVFSRY